MKPVTIEKGIKLAEIVHGMPDDEQITFLKNLGIEFIELWIPEENITLDTIQSYKQRFEAAGLTLFSVDSLNTFQSCEFILGFPGLEKKIAQWESFIRNLGKAGLHTTTYGWSCENVGATGEAETRGCTTRTYDYDKVKNLPNAYGRPYSEEELWDNYERFMRRILPVAEGAGVRLALHPNDPPVPVVNGIPQIFRSNESFKRAMEIANHSPYSGIAFCVGTWGEMAGPDGKGEDILGAIRHFGKTGNIFTVHFRNVNSPLPCFYETFVDNGYVNMYRVMKEFRLVNYNGTMVPDHVPVFTNEKMLGHESVSGSPYTIGYMRALLHALDAEVR